MRKRNYEKILNIFLEKVIVITMYMLYVGDNKIEVITCAKI